MSTELDIERDFIRILSEKENQWRYRPDIKTEADLWGNFFSHLDRLNVAVLKDIKLSIKETKKFKSNLLALQELLF